MKTVRAYIDRHANGRGDSTFLVVPESGHEISYAGLQAGVSNIRDGLDRIGVARGARTAFLMDNRQWNVQLFLGVMACNRVIVPLNAVTGTVQLEYVLDHSDVEVVFVSVKYQNRLSELLRSVQREIVVITVDENSGPHGAQIPGDPIHYAKPGGRADGSL